MPAFLLELGLYLVPGFAAVRKAFEKLGAKPQRALLLTASGAIAYLVESPLTGTFHFSSLALLVAVVLVTSFWYVAVRPSLPADLLFLAFMAAVYVSKFFDQVYGTLPPHVPLAILGKLMWIRVGLLAVLSLRGMEDVGFGFVPSLREWRVGIQYYLYLLPVGVGLSYLVGFEVVNGQVERG